MDARAEKRLETAVLIAIVVVGTAVRVVLLDRPMQLDEAYTYNEYASKPILDGLSWYTLPNNHLLNTLLIHVSTVVFGNERWAVRLPALAAGLGLIPAIFALTGRLCGRSAALLAAALVAASEPLIDYSTNARGYTLVALFTVLLALSGQRILAGGEGGRAGEWVGFTALAVLGGFAIPIMLYPYGGIVLWLLLEARWPAVGRPRPLRLDRLVLSGVGAALLLVILYLPAIVRTGLARVAANPYVTSRPLDEVVRGLPRTLGLAWLQWNNDVPRTVAVLFLLAWAASLVRLLRRRSRASGCWFHADCSALAVLGFSVLAALAQRVVPYDRVWLFMLPLYLACVAEGLSEAALRLPLPALFRPGLALLLCLGLSLCVVRGESLAPRSWATLHHADAIAALLKPILRPDDGVVALTPCDAPLKYEFLRHQIPVEYLYDYQVARARRLFVAVDRPNHQDLSGVLAGSAIAAARFTPPTLVRDFGDTALFELRRRSAEESGERSLSKAPSSFTMEAPRLLPWCAPRRGSVVICSRVSVRVSKKIVRIR